MLGLVGTIPIENIPLLSGTIALDGDHIVLENERISVNRGTPAMIAAAAETLAYMGKPSPVAYLVGDIGDGDGSRHLYNHLSENIGEYSLKTLALHYFQPDVHLFKKLFSTIYELDERPTLVGDAGFMYVAKMGGDAALFDLLTPDAGELAYLADEKAPHPFYTRGFILHEDNQVPDLIARAYRHKNASTYLLVKGATDYIADENGVIATVDQPQEEALEAIGGTGDTLTGIVSALIESGMDMESAAINAARVNRLAGAMAKPTPATQVYEVIRQIPRALDQVLNA